MRKRTSTVCWLAVVLAGCQGNPSTGGREAVRFKLDDGMISHSLTTGSLIVLEFGSLACEYCREFQDSVLPIIARRLEDGQTAWGLGYVIVDTFPPYSGLAARARCDLPSLGLKSAVDAAFDRAAALRDSPGGTDTPDEILSDDPCIAAQAEAMHKLSRRASEWGVRITPTFLIGTVEGEFAVGWVVKGLRAELILATVDSVRARQIAMASSRNR